MSADAPTQPGPHRAAYRFFGRSIAVASDHPGVIEALDAVYARQRLELAGGPADLDVRVLRGATGATRAELGPRIEAGGRTIRVPAPDQLVHYAHLVLINAAAALATDAVVLHAGAVTMPGGAVLLLGHSGLGKTTLTVELVRRGCGFLSDDFAVLGADGDVQPFPRRVNLTDASLGLLGLAPPPQTVRLAGFRGQVKSMVDIEDLFPGSLAGATPLAALAVLGPAPHTTGAAGTTAPVWRIEVDHTPPGFTAELAAMPGVQAVTAVGTDTGTVFEVATAPGALLVRGLDELCRRRDVTVLAAGRRAGTGPAPGGAVRPPPRRDGPPVVTALSADALMPELLPYALSLSGARFFHHGGQAELLRTIGLLHSALARPVRLVRIEPGALAPTADAVQALAAP